jgi:hypothetical protein
MDFELLHSGYIILRKDRENKRGGGVLVAVKSESFRTVREYITPL